jgi:hypothetical protein
MMFTVPSAADLSKMSVNELYALSSFRELIDKLPRCEWGAFRGERLLFNVAGERCENHALWRARLGKRWWGSAKFLVCDEHRTVAPIRFPKEDDELPYAPALRRLLRLDFVKEEVTR